MTIVVGHRFEMPRSFCFGRPSVRGRGIEVLWVLGSLVYVHATRTFVGDVAVRGRDSVPLALTGAQLICTGVLSGVLLCRNGERRRGGGRAQNTASFIEFTSLACLHAVGVHAQHVAYVSLNSASAVQLIRSLEVWCAIIVGHIFGLKSSLNAIKLHGLFFMTASV